MQIKRPKQSVGFTLIEMLVVIGVITLLMAALVPVIAGMITTARLKATQATIKMLHEMLDSRMEAFDRAFEPGGKNKFKSQIDALSLQGYTPVEAEIRVRKQMMVEYFPQRFIETGFYDNNTELTEPAGHKSVTESAECLYYIIFQGKTLDAEPADEDRMKNAIKDTDRDGLMEFVDAWGNPLRFYRWPTRLVRPGTAASPASPSDAINTSITNLMLPGISTEMLKQDPDDILNRLHNASPWNGDAAAFEYNSSSPTLSFHTVSTFNRFIIVSAGPDGVLGLYEPHDTVNYGHLARPTEDTLDSNLNDDICNRQLTGGN